MKNKGFNDILLVIILSTFFVLGLFYIKTNKTDNKHETTFNSPANIQTDKLQLEDFPNREFLGETDKYSVYFVNAVGEYAARVGELIVYNKTADAVIKIDGAFSIFGSTIIYNYDEGDYILLSTGTYILRGATVISLESRKRAVEDFCISVKPIFWEGYLVYSNCDTFGNRPWGAGEAPSIAAVNLNENKTKVIFKSDLTKHYYLEKIEKDTLYYEEIYVENDGSWEFQESQKTLSKTYNLLDL